MPPPPSRDDVRIFASAADFRVWLEDHHDTGTELWVGFYKKGVPKTSMTYAESVDEALCFGWIDGLTRRMDEEVYTIRFTPRRRTSSWSAINIAKVAELTAAGRMQPAGMRAYEERDQRKDASYSYERPVQELPPEMRARLEADASAWAAWQSQAPSFRRQATHWILSGKRPETRERRLRNLAQELAAGRLPRPFRVTRRDREDTRAR
ncbi:MAG: YdeI/OmpD-associated family protein [Candidatus Limnocylindria bacterium]